MSRFGRTLYGYGIFYTYSVFKLLYFLVSTSTTHHIGHYIVYLLHWFCFIVLIGLLVFNVCHINKRLLNLITYLLMNDNYEKLRIIRFTLSQGIESRHFDWMIGVYSTNLFGQIPKVTLWLLFKQKMQLFIHSSCFNKIRDNKSNKIVTEKMHK